LQTFIDGLISAITLYILLSAKRGVFSFHYEILLVLALLLMFTYYNAGGVYHDNTDSAVFFIKLLRAWGLVALTLVLIGFLTKTSDIFSRQVIVTWLIVSFLAQFGANFLIIKMSSGIRELAGPDEKALLIGAGGVSRSLIERINDNLWMSSEIIGVLEDREDLKSLWDKPVPILGGFDDAERIIREGGISCVYIALPLADTALVEKLHTALLPTNVDIRWVPDLSGLTLINPNVREIGGMPVFSLSETPLSGINSVSKTVFDVCASAAALALLSPVMLLTAAAIRIWTPGPVFFRQRRHGWNGAEINIWKFRSMVVHSEKEGVVTQAAENDARVTRLGHFLRKTSIDELPQLINVLLGEMSLVGPRPHAVEHNRYYSKKIDDYFVRHKIKPGITGLAQVSGFRGGTETLEKMKMRVDLDLEYINNWSLALDMKILFKTILVLFSKDAY
jgi:putative colanic acid biosynthesis UDP-glucose lipid carrier transferase